MDIFGGFCSASYGTAESIKKTRPGTGEGRHLLTEGKSNESHREQGNTASAGDIIFLSLTKQTLPLYRVASWIMNFLRENH